MHACVRACVLVCVRVCACFYTFVIEIILKKKEDTRTRQRIDCIEVAMVTKKFFR